MSTGKIVEVAPAPTGADARAAINAYVYGLTYDPRELLAVRAPGSTESLKPRDETGDSVIICRVTPKKLSVDLQEVTILSPAAGTVYPGALVKVNRQLAEGAPTLISLPRAPAVLRVDLPGLGPEGTLVVDRPTNSRTQGALQDVLESWNARPAAQGYVNEARSSYTSTVAQSADQLALHLGFSAKWAGNAVSGKLDFQKSSRSWVTVALYRQVFYSVTLDPPTDPAAVFAPEVTLDDVRRVVDDANPPGYVRQVDYGRLIMVRMETHEAAEQARLEAALDYVTAGGVDLDADSTASYERIAKNSRFDVLTLGGNAEVASTLVSDHTKVPEVIARNARYTRDNPGHPVAYQVSFLKDNQLALMSFATDYVETECTEYPNGFVRLRHDGGYVAKWDVSYLDPNGVRVTAYRSGKVTAPWQQTVDLPGDARSVRIHAQAQTGLLWDPWREAISVTEAGVTNKGYKIFGTTLSPRWNNNC